jgi:hypothetical protein
MLKFTEATEMARHNVTPGCQCPKCSQAARKAQETQVKHIEEQTMSYVTKPISSSDDIIDSRDVIARIEELEGYRKGLIDAITKAEDAVKGLRRPLTRQRRNWRNGTQTTARS